MALDHERCGVEGCTVHVGLTRETPLVKRNHQIREDFVSGDWTVEELSSFWDLTPSAVSRIVATRRVESARARTPALEVSHSR